MDKLPKSNPIYVPTNFNYQKHRRKTLHAQIIKSKEKSFVFQRKVSKISLQCGFILSSYSLKPQIWQKTCQTTLCIVKISPRPMVSMDHIFELIKQKLNISSTELVVQQWVNNVRHYFHVVTNTGPRTRIKRHTI